MFHFSEHFNNIICFKLIPLKFFLEVNKYEFNYFIFNSGVEGFEPPNGEAKIRCLTT